jgi:hypothetical protein
VILNFGGNFSASISHTSAAVAICIYFTLIPSPATHRAQYLLITWHVETGVILLYCYRGVLLYQMAPSNSTCPIVTNYTPSNTIQQAIITSNISFTGDQHQVESNTSKIIVPKGFSLFIKRHVIMCVKRTLWFSNSNNRKWMNKYLVLCIKKRMQ